MRALGRNQGMTDPQAGAPVALLQTKLYPPRVTQELVDRPRLGERLGRRLGDERSGGAWLRENGGLTQVTSGEA